MNQYNIKKKQRNKVVGLRQQIGADVQKFEKSVWKLACEKALLILTLMSVSSGIACALAVKGFIDPHYLQTSEFVLNTSLVSKTLFGLLWYQL